jgi:hypothetical protein
VLTRDERRTPRRCDGPFFASDVQHCLGTRDILFRGDRGGIGIVCWNRAGADEPIETLPVGRGAFGLCNGCTWSSVPRRHRRCKFSSASRLAARRSGAGRFGVH